MNLTKDEIENAIKDYYQNSINNVETRMDILDYGIHLDFYINELKKDNNKFIEKKRPLTNDEIVAIFNNYLKDTIYEVNNSKCIGMIRKLNYHVVEDTPIFEGLKLAIKKREKAKILKK